MNSYSTSADACDNACSALVVVVPLTSLPSDIFVMYDVPRPSHYDTR